MRMHVYTVLHLIAFIGQLRLAIRITNSTSDPHSCPLGQCSYGARNLRDHQKCIDTSNSLPQDQDHFSLYRTLRPQDTSSPRHFGPAWDTPASSQDTSAPKTWYETLRHQIDEKSGHFRPMDNSDKTQLHRWFGLKLVPKCLGAEMSCGRNVLWPKCPPPDVSRSVKTACLCIFM